MGQETKHLFGESEGAYDIEGTWRQGACLDTKIKKRLLLLNPKLRYSFKDREDQCPMVSYRFGGLGGPG